MLPSEKPRRHCHQRTIQLVRVMVNIPPQKRRAYRGRHNSITIGLAPDVVPSMKSRVNIVGNLDAHGGREQIIQCLDKIGTGNSGFGVEIRYLVLGVDAGIRSSRPTYFRGSPGQLVKSSFQASLNCGSVRLTLPATKIGSIVSQDQSNVSHGGFILPSGLRLM